MKMTKAKLQAMHIAQEAIFSALDLNDQMSTGHVQCAFEVWANADIRTGTDSMERDEFRAEVRQILATLGYPF